MKKKFKAILSLAAVSAVCLLGAACNKEKTLIEDYQDKGYKVLVTYDANGGSFMNRPGVTVVDLFNPSNYTAGGDGKVHIKLTEPTDPTRPTSGDESIVLTKTEHFFAGWYETRTLVDEGGNELEQTKEDKFVKKGTKEESNPVDKDGNKLELADDGSFVVKGTKTKSDPAYAYSDYWDFETDTIDYAEGDGKVEMTLYAGWVPYYEFHYYYKVDGSEADWEYVDKTSFDYKTTNAEGSQTQDKDTIWIPEWENGVMDHKHAYASSGDYTFPKVAGTTFMKAYTDSACQNEIVDSFEHGGTLDLETGKAIGRIQNVYVVVEGVERFKISTAKQLSDNGNAQGVYEICADLDFSEEGVSWPMAFSSGTFEGQMYSATGATVKIKNVSVSHNSDTAQFGGIFGQIAAKAKVQNLAFENATFTLENGGQRLVEAKYGLFAGEIVQGATLSVSVSGEFRLGTIQSLGSDYCINVVANGVKTGVTNQGVTIAVYGQDLYAYFYYTVDFDTVAVDVDGNITFSYITDSTKSQQQEQFIPINY